MKSRAKSDLLSTDHWIDTDTFSPDGRWFVLEDGTALHQYIAPVRQKPVAQNEWIAFANEGTWLWPNRSLLYAILSIDDHSCVWAQHVDPTTQRPVGPPVAVFHSHSARLSLMPNADSSFDIAAGKMVFSMGERTGNIWMAEWNER